MEIRNDPQGKPRMVLRGAARDRAQQMRIGNVLVTISHCRAYATAFALAVKTDGVLAFEDEDE
jgi:holo-[acyl-carrier protein] synthase